MLEQQNEPLEVRRIQLAGAAVKRMRDGVRDLSGLQVTLQSNDIVADDCDVGVLRFGNPPDEDMNLAGVLRERGRDLLAKESSGQIANLEATLDRIVVGERNVIHPALEQLFIQLARVGVAIGKV